MNRKRTYWGKPPSLLPLNLLPGLLTPEKILSEQTNPAKTDPPLCTVGAAKKVMHQLPVRSGPVTELLLDLHNSKLQKLLMAKMVIPHWVPSHTQVTWETLHLETPPHPHLVACFLAS